MCPYVVMVGGMSKGYIQCVHVYLKSLLSELHMPENHLTHNFITYKKSTNKSKKGFYVKTMTRVGEKTTETI